MVPIGVKGISTHRARCTTVVWQNFRAAAPATTSEPAGLVNFDTSEEGTSARLSAIRQAICSFPAESAAGPSGLRPNHLKDLVGNGAETDA